VNLHLRVLSRQRGIPGAHPLVPVVFAFCSRDPLVTLRSGWSVFVPVAIVEGVTVTVVEVVDVVTVLDRFVAASRSMLMISVIFVLSVNALALVPVAIVEVVHMAIVEVVDMVAVDDRGVSATGAVLVLVVFVDVVGSAHDGASSACRIASRAMWITCSSAIT
jgi:hypothetical protein